MNDFNDTDPGDGTTETPAPNARTLAHWMRTVGYLMMRERAEGGDVAERVSDAVTPEQLAATIASLEAIAVQLADGEELPQPGQRRHRGFGPGFGRGFGPGFAPPAPFAPHHRGHGHSHDHGHRGGRRAQHAYERGFDAGFARGREAGGASAA